MDVVLDPVSADSQRRSFGVLKKGGILVALTEEPQQDCYACLIRRSGYYYLALGGKAITLRPHGLMAGSGLLNHYCRVA